MLEAKKEGPEKLSFFHLTLKKRGIILFKRMCLSGIEKRHRSLISEKRRKRNEKNISAEKETEKKRARIQKENENSGRKKST